MKTTLTFTFMVAILMYMSANAQVEFKRVCSNDQLDIGIRRAPWHDEAIHTCVRGPLNSNCFAQDASRGFNCTGNFQLQGGLPNRRAWCCKKEVEWWRPVFIGGRENTVTMSPGRDHRPSASKLANFSHNIFNFVLDNCFVPPRLFSHRRRFDIIFRGRVLRSLLSYPTPDDMTTFIIELCTLRRPRSYDRQ